MKHPRSSGRSVALAPAAALAFAVAAAGGAAAQQEGGAEPTAAREACAAPEHRHFDFWIGEWTVTGADGEVAGRNSIRPILNGCALREEWRGAGGDGAVTGTSYNAYDARRGVWHQTWVDRNGLVLLIEGGLDPEGRMVLTGELRDPDGERSMHRITWTPAGPDEVRQHWERSADGGESWTTVFDGVYRRTGSGS